ncbi:UNKNOWN [Stylonychia lemnae]|uniref:Proteinase inhibitor I42 chagasin domain-containing protein n=1 Tax=Stylonychia lemnae TaxID=5949 RepID=A0A078B6W8_STYLE|nr:UNKNOWN [Stylonychia lemnae]|eukprot:CDW89931.1 UNKNOWN [Stylonychia lemnae]
MNKFFSSIAIVLSLFASLQQVQANLIEYDLDSPEHRLFLKTNPVIMKVGDQLRLVVNENPTTGFVWIYRCLAKSSEEAVFKVVEETYRRDIVPYEELTGMTMSGVGGTKILTLEATKKGSDNFQMANARPWEFSGFEQYSAENDDYFYQDIRITVQ